MTPNKRRAWLQLGVAAVATLTIWTIVLPWVGSWQPMRTRIQSLEQRGIDPAALFYTDLEAMAALEARVAKLRDEHPEAFWVIGTASAE